MNCGLVALLVVGIVTTPQSMQVSPEKMLSVVVGKSLNVTRETVTSELRPLVANVLKSRIAICAVASSIHTDISADESTEHSSGPLPSVNVTGIKPYPDELAVVLLCAFDDAIRLLSPIGWTPLAEPVAVAVEVGKIAMRAVGVENTPKAVDPVVDCAGSVVVVVVAVVLVVVVAAVVVVVPVAVVVVVPATVVVVVAVAAGVELSLPPQPVNANRINTSQLPF